MSDKQDEILRILVWLLENPEHVHKADPFQIEINYLHENKRMLGKPEDKLQDEARLALALVRALDERYG